MKIVNWQTKMAKKKKDSVYVVLTDAKMNVSKRPVKPLRQLRLRPLLITFVPIAFERSVEMKSVSIFLNSIVLMFQ